MQAHHAAWDLRNGQPVPAGMRLHRTCQTPECVRHWVLDRQYRKLDERAVRAIRESRLSGPALAKLYRIGREYAWKIKRGLARRT